MMNFKDLLYSRANGLIHGAQPEASLPLGFGETLKQARANAVAFNASRDNGNYFYSFYPWR